MRNVTLEEAWAELRDAGFNHQYEDGWFAIHPGKVLVGRALTAQWLPGRPDIHKVIEEQGKQDGRVGGQNAWPVDMLQPRDVYVCDHFGLKENGPSIGDNVGNAIYARSHNGIVYDGAVRDISGLKELDDFVSFVRSYDPSHHFCDQRAAAELDDHRHQHAHPDWQGHRDAWRCSAGPRRRRDLHPAAARRARGAILRVDTPQDLFGHQRLREGKYTAGQIDAAWTPAIEEDFSGWLRENIDKLPVPRAQVQEILNRRRK